MAFHKNDKLCILLAVCSSDVKVSLNTCQGAKEKAAWGSFCYQKQQLSKTIITSTEKSDSRLVGWLLFPPPPLPTLLSSEIVSTEEVWSTFFQAPACLTFPSNVTSVFSVSPWCFQRDFEEGKRTLVVVLLISTVPLDIVIRLSQ